MMTWRAGPGDELTWQGGDVARGTTAPLRRGTEATWQGRVWPTRDAWLTRVRVYHIVYIIGYRTYKPIHYGLADDIMRLPI